jgi:hypothetical protein
MPTREIFDNSKRAAIRDWTVCALWAGLIFLTVPLGNQIRDWLLLARKPAEVARYELALPARSLSAFPLVSHGSDGFSVFELKEGRLRFARRLEVNHELAVFVLDRLCVTRGTTLEVRRYQKDRPPELLRTLNLPARPVEMIAWREPYVAARYPDGLIQVLDVNASETNAPHAEFRPDARVSRMGNLLWDLPLATTHGVLFWREDSAPPFHYRTESPVTTIESVRGRIMVGEEDGTVHELRRTGGGFEARRSVRLPHPAIAMSGTRFALFIGCRNGSLAVVDWRDEDKLVLKHVSRGAGEVTDFRFYGEQGFALIGPKTLAQFNPMPGNRLAAQSVAALLAILGVSLLAWLLVKRRERSVVRYAVLGLVAVLYVIDLRRILATASPIEAAHFIEYGVLGVLAVRALRHHLDDWGVYPVAFLICALMGIADEVFQWLHPARAEDLRDVLLNMRAGALMLVAFAFGAPLDGQRRAIGKRSQRVLGALLLVTLLGLAVFIQFLCRFGHEIHVANVGKFVSRFSESELRRMDAERSEQFAPRLEAMKELPYEETLKRLEDERFLYELRVHLFRRDVHFGRAGHFVAYKENQLIELYFSNTVSRTAYRWSDDQKQKCRSEIGAELNADYRSPVSAQLITRYGPVELWAVTALVAAVCIWLMGRRVA